MYAIIYWTKEWKEPLPFLEPNTSGFMVLSIFKSLELADQAADDLEKEFKDEERECRVINIDSVHE